MPSKLKSETARINGAKSRGPKSPETRQKSSRNALDHGLTAASTIVLACEIPEEFKKFLDEYMAVHQPANAAERDLVDQMAAARWRIRRAGVIETGIIDCEMVSNKSEVLKKFPQADSAIHLAQAVRSLADGSRSLALMSRYESRHQRTYERAYKTLRELQQARKSEEQAALSALKQSDGTRVGQADSLPAPAPAAKPLKIHPPTPEIRSAETNPPHPANTASEPNPEPHPGTVECPRKGTPDA